MLPHPQRGAKRAALQEFYFVSSVQVPMLLFEIRIDVPGVPLFWLVIKSLKQISANRVPRTTGVRFGGCERFAAAAFIKQASDAA